jgi:hypothetical protein
VDVTLTDTLALLLKWGIVRDVGGGRYQMRPLPEAVRRLKSQSLLQRVMQIQDSDDAFSPGSSLDSQSAAAAGDSSNNTSYRLYPSSQTKAATAAAAVHRALPYDKQSATVAAAISSTGNLWRCGDAPTSSTCVLQQQRGRAATGMVRGERRRVPGIASVRSARARVYASSAQLPFSALSQSPRVR